MNDNDVDSRLREHGAAWRAANHDRPAVDWEAVTGSPRHGRRTWYAVAGAAIAAAAIVVPLALVAAHNVGAPSLSPAAARQGAPKGLVTISQGRVEFQSGGGGYGVHPSPGHPVVAIGVGSPGLVTYTASRLSGCRVALDRVRPNLRIVRGVPSFGATGGPVRTVSGHEPDATADSLAPSMVVSPDGTKLAMVLVPPNPAYDPGKYQVAPCNGAEEIVVVDLQTGQVQTSHAQGADELIGSLAWSPDSRRLAFHVQMACLTVNADTSSCSGLATLGTHVMDTTGQLRGLDQAPQVLPYREDISTDTAYDPNVFWWHGHLATIQGGELRAIDGHGHLGATLAKGFPAHVLRVSSDSTGNHLLLQAGPTATEDDNGKTVATAATYRWDRGVLAKVYGGSYSITGVTTTDLYQPGW